MIWLAIALLSATLLVALGWRRSRSRFDWHPPELRQSTRSPRGKVETVFFESNGVRLEGWLFTPASPADLVVVMAPGLVGTKDAHLEPFAWDFVASGAAVLLFDFRTLGGSAGTPRHWVDPFRQMEDYEAALDYAAHRFQRAVLWGSSFSAGVALCVAARCPESVAGVIAQVPFLHTTPDLQPTGLRMARYVVLATLDLALSSVSGGRAPAVYIPAFGKPGEFAFSPSDECPSRKMNDLGDAHLFWRALPSPLRGGWRNVLCARMLANMDRFDPMDVVADIRCPVLLVAAERDDLTPASIARQAAERCPQAKLAIVPGQHFDVYMPPIREQRML